MFNRKGELNGDNGHGMEKNDGDPGEVDVEMPGTVPPVSGQSSQTYAAQQQRTWEAQKTASRHPHLLPVSMRNPVGKDTYYEEDSSPGNALAVQVDLFGGGYGVDNLIKHTEFSMMHHVQSNETVLGTFRSSIQQEVFEKIKDRINASREREKLSVAKQILRKEEERKKLARDRDANDLQSKINTLSETLELEKGRRQKFYALLKQKKNAEEAIKRQQQGLRERGRDMGNNNHPPQQQQQHSYPNASMLISQTNPSMQRPRIMNYQHMGMPTNNSVGHQSSSHLDMQSSTSSKRQRSISPNPAIGQHHHQQSRNCNDMNYNRNPPPGPGPGPGQVNPKMYRSHLAPPNDSHQMSSSSQSPRSSGVKSPNKAQGGMVSNAGHQMTSQSQGMGLPYAIASPYAMPGMGNQVLMVMPNMVGGQAGQLINPALLQQKPEHLQALTPQQQQALMAQHLQTLNPANQDYLRAMIENQMRGAGAGSAEALYRQYAAVNGMMGPQMMVRTQMPPNNNTANNAPSPHSLMSQQQQQSSNDASQRVGSIMTGMPVFGPTNTNSYGNSSALPPPTTHHYSRSGANS